MEYTEILSLFFKRVSYYMSKMKRKRKTKRPTEEILSIIWSHRVTSVVVML
jgi:hypothetical protein